MTGAARPPLATWRWLDTGAAPGDWNMAFDDAMLDAHRAGLVPPTLRFYRWARPTLSLGYAQAPDSLDLEAAWAAGVDVVRRPTGGRAVLHAGDLTYAVVASDLPPSVAASYRVIAGALANGLARLGLSTALVPGTAAPTRSAACFASASLADMTLGGRKAIGSAQVRRAGAVLQHGSLYLVRPVALAALILPDEPAVADLGGLAWETVREALTAGFASTLGVKFEPGEPTRAEREQAAANRHHFAVEST